MKSRTLRSFGAATATLATLLSVLAGCSGPISTGMASSQGWSAMTYSANEPSPVVLFYGDKARLTQLVNAGMDVWSVDVLQKRAKGTLTPLQAELAQKLGMSVQPAPKMAQRVDKGYRTYEQVSARLKELAAKNPGVAEVVDIGDSWEKTQNKGTKEILALKIGKGNGKPIVTFVGCHHARELVTPEMVLMQAEHLLENYGKDAEVTAAVETREIWLVPMVNPDGHAHALEGDSWRKNTNNITGGKRNFGVDLNRNYAKAWGTVGDSNNPDSDTFRGASAFSEPETQAVRDLVTKHKPVVYLTFHSFSNCVMWPWDHQNAPPPDKRLAQLGTQLGKLSGYQAYQGSEMYLNGGDDVDWIFDKLGSLSYTVEVGSWSDGFMPPFAKVAKFFNENRPMMMYALKVADNPGQTEGPSAKFNTTRGLLALSAPKAQRAEAFIGTPGRAGTGTPVALANGQAVLPAVPGGRQLVFVHAQGANGVWGPWEITWSK